MSDTQIHSPIDAVKLLGEHLCLLDREVVCVVNLRSDGRPICCNFVSIGSINECVIHPRELLKSAILTNSTYMIIVHNHPSGNLTPSKEDTIVTSRMLKVCDLMGIPLLDHVIVGGRNKNYFSFKEKGMLEFEHEKYESNYENLSFPKTKVAESMEDALRDVTPKIHRGR